MLENFRANVRKKHAHARVLVARQAPSSQFSWQVAAFKHPSFEAVV